MKRETKKRLLDFLAGATFLGWILLAKYFGQNQEAFEAAGSWKFLAMAMFVPPMLRLMNIFWGPSISELEAQDERERRERMKKGVATLLLLVLTFSLGCSLHQAEIVSPQSQQIEELDVNIHIFIDHATETLLFRGLQTSKARGVFVHALEAECEAKNQTDDLVIKCFMSITVKETGYCYGACDRKDEDLPRSFYLEFEDFENGPPMKVGGFSFLN